MIFEKIELIRHDFASIAPDEKIQFLGKAGNYRTRQQLADVSSLTPTCGEWLYNQVIQAKPQNAIEVGACIGIGTLYIAAALQKLGAGQVVSIEGSPVLAQFARLHIVSAGMQDYAHVVEGTFEAVLAGVVNLTEPVDFAFLDGEHTKEATLRDFDVIVNGAGAGATIIIDDIKLRDRMGDTWETICADKRVVRYEDAGRLGVVWLK